MPICWYKNVQLQNIGIFTFHKPYQTYPEPNTTKIPVPTLYVTNTVLRDLYPFTNSFTQFIFFAFIKVRFFKKWWAFWNLQVWVCVCICDYLSVRTCVWVCPSVSVDIYYLLCMQCKICTHRVLGQINDVIWNGHRHCSGMGGFITTCRLLKLILLSSGQCKKHMLSHLCIVKHIFNDLDQFEIHFNFIVCVWGQIVLPFQIRTM